MTLTPLIAVHATAAIAALLIGPVALWARRGPATHHHPRLHRAAGYAWVTLMLLTALSAVFIRGNQLPGFAGFSAIHLLVPITLGTLFIAFRHLLRGRIARHRNAMVSLYIASCLIAGAFTLLPQRYLGHLLWSQWLGLV